jgi:hypothetical protein
MPDRNEGGVIVPTQMKPKLFAEAIAATVAEAAARHDILDVGREARRIALQSGLSPYVVAANLMEAGRYARVAMELPTAAQLERGATLPG